MKLLTLGVALAAAMSPASAHATSNAKFVSQYAKVTGCKEVGHGDLERGQDWVSFRCKGLGSIPVWYICQDSARCRYGFGVRPNVSGPFGISGGELLEWRGPTRSGRFKPIAVIIRLPSADPEAIAKNSLVVYRLRADGTSCIVGATYSNGDAKKIADGSANHFQCVGEPDDPR